MADKKKQEKKKAGAQSSSDSHKRGIATYFASGRCNKKKLRRVLKMQGIAAARVFAKDTGLTSFLETIAPAERLKAIETAEQRRRIAREARAAARLVAALVRHEAERAAEAAAKAAAEKKALLSARAKKGAATKAAKKAAKLASEQATAIQAELTTDGIK